ncbi:protein of unknown function [Kyrpidia spormannii]|uniref:Uncharacterized protein n=2 Tax=Kyrpidia spormannii TaxID=2055160 RepID=A0ACA8Z520_9BACL|nr:protein of unknown function [Kyrpidia spormannii]CAB3390296.1 protein of unknown function [Kyrpidia spormannii]
MSGTWCHLHDESPSRMFGWQCHYSMFEAVGGRRKLRMRGRIREPGSCGDEGRASVEMKWGGM